MTACTRTLAALTVLCVWCLSPVAGQAGTTRTMPLHAGELDSALVEPAVAPHVEARSNFGTLGSRDLSRRAVNARLRTPGAVTVAVRNDATGLRSTCQHAITLWDSYGDGWTGGYIDVYVDGALALGGVTLSGGYGPETVYVDVNDGDAITTVWTPGDYPREASYCIYNAVGAELGCDGVSGIEPTGLAVTADCLRTGACCNPFDGTCTDGVDIDNCAPPLEFTLGTLCNELSPSCGDSGACCDDIAGECRIDYRANCAGRFISGGTCDDFDPNCGDYRPCAHTIEVSSSSNYGWNQGNSYVDVYVDGVLTLAGLTVQGLCTGSVLHIPRRRWQRHHNGIHLGRRLVRAA